MAYSREEVISRFKDVHGDLYDYSLVPEIVQRLTGKVVVKCNTHNHEWSVTSCEHIAGKACKFCGYDKMTSKSRMTVGQFIDKSNKKHNNKFDYSKVVYINARTPVTIFCPEHNIDFTSQPHVHLKSKFGCPECESDLKGKHKTKRTRESVVEEFVAKHGEKYTYEKFVFQSMKIGAIITCTVHGDFSIRPDYHLRGRGGCKDCGNESKIMLQRRTAEDFVKVAQAVHGESTYDYSDVKYKNGQSKVHIRCYEHGLFSQRASKHLEGSGCPDCAKTGFSVFKNATMYVLKASNITKVGITNLPVRIRQTAVSNDSGLNFDILTEFKFKVGQNCTDIETILLREMRKIYKSPQEKFDGYTECFYDVDYGKLISRIEELIKEYNE